MRTEYQEQAKVFKALCDPKRLSILEQLRSGEKCACVLQEPLDLTQSGLSYHMKILCDSGIVVGTPTSNFDVILRSEYTADLYGEYNYQIEITSPTGDVFRPVEGNLIIKQRNYET